MMRQFKYIPLFAVLLGLSGCGAGNYGSSYKAYHNPDLMPNIVRLAEGEEPNLIRSNDLDNDVQFYREHNYVVIGESAFNGTPESEGRAVKQAKEIGATHVIVSSEYTDTKSYIDYDYQDYYRTVYVPRVRVINGEKVAYTKAVTVRDTVTVPYRRFYDNYDQWAVYLVKSNEVNKLGLVLRDLTPADRTRLGRNTGAFVDIVLSNSPAFLANIMPQDVIVGINGSQVQNSGHAQELLRTLEADGQDITLTVLHDGTQKDITMEFVATKASNQN